MLCQFWPVARTFFNVVRRGNQTTPVGSMETAAPPTLGFPIQMKLKIVALSLVALGSTFAAAIAQNTSQYPAAIPAGGGNEKESMASTPPLTRAEALKIIAESRRYVAHPGSKPNSKVAPSEVTTPDFAMAGPPPPPRVETKVAAPGATYVWVPGHFMPVKGEWRWVRGEWAVPATVISVWIAARYDEKDKKWSPGYWQPDAPTPAPAPSSATAQGSAAPAAPTPSY